MVHTRIQGSLLIKHYKKIPVFNDTITAFYVLRTYDCRKVETHVYEWTYINSDSKTSSLYS